MLSRLFGRTRSLQQLNRALGEVGLVADGFQEAARLTLIRLVKEAQGLPQRGEPSGEAAARLQAALGSAAHFFAYCFLGAQDYGERLEDGEAQERRLALALEAPEGLEARIVSLALISGYAHESLAARFETTLEDGG